MTVTRVSSTLFAVLWQGVVIAVFSHEPSVGQLEKLAMEVK